MREMALMAIYPRPRITERMERSRYPCLLRRLPVDRVDQVWCSDITYIRMRRGFLYLAAVMDYVSRYVLSWSLSNSLDSLFCLEALDAALAGGQPEIFHSDQGKQYSSTAFTARLKGRGIAISMSGKGRCFDNILVERLWRTLKYEEVYLHEYEDGRDLRTSLAAYLAYYNHRRPHASLGYRTPGEVYAANCRSPGSASAAPPLRQASG